MGVLSQIFSHNEISKISFVQGNSETFRSFMGSYRTNFCFSNEASGNLISREKFKFTGIFPEKKIAMLTIIAPMPGGKNNPNSPRTNSLLYKRCKL